MCPPGGFNPDNTCASDSSACESTRIDVYLSAGVIAPCPPGTVANADWSGCVPCGPGSYAVRL